MSRSTICVSTGTRADYGLLYWLMRDLQNHSNFNLSIIASAMHLSPEFGNTITFLEEDGFEIDAKVRCLDGDDTSYGMARSFVRAIDGFTLALNQIKPDLLVVLGDRFEALAAANAATLLDIPVAHIHGGELTLGAIDEVFRHAITKHAHLHFTAAPEYRNRVIQMGEHPERTFDVGAIGLDNFRRLELLSSEANKSNLGLPSDCDYVLVTYHPATKERGPAVGGLEPVLEALEQFPWLHLVITKSNSDPGGRGINAGLEAFAEADKDRVRLVSSLGQIGYMTALQNAKLVIGNSSSGIIEAPAVNVPTINIGQRQKGRLRAASVIDVDPNTQEIVKGIQKGLDPAFRLETSKKTPPYGRPANTTAKIIAHLEAVDFSSLKVKHFYDLP